MSRGGWRRAFRLALRRRDRITADTDDEIQLHLEMRAEALVRRGVAPARARQEALRRFGPYEQARADLVAAALQRERTLTMHDRLDGLRHDLRYALRQVRRSPAATLTIVATFALGIGANATTFGLVDHLLLRAPAHVAAPHELQQVETHARSRGEGYIGRSFSYPAYRDLRDGVPAFAGVAAQTWPSPLSLGTGAEAREVQHALVSGDWFATLGPRMAAGRPILPHDDVPPHGSAVAVISQGLWRREFGSDPNVLGSSIVLASRSYTIIGVAPAGFVGVQKRPVDVWIPISAGAELRLGSPEWTTERSSTWLSVVARLRAGASADVAEQQAAAALRAGAAAALGSADTTTRVELSSVLPRDQALTAQAHVALLVAAVSFLVLAIACANVGNLLLARALDRRRETAVRLALGISRARLVRQLVLEGVILAVLGGAAALLVVQWGSDLARRALLAGYAWPESVIDARILAFILGTTMLVGLLAGLVPGLRASAPDLSQSLKEGARGLSGSQSRTRSALLLAQSALSVLLLVGTGLFVRSLHNVNDVHLGIDAERLLVGSIDLASIAMDGATSEQYFRDVVQRVRELPGVADATVAEAQPFGEWSMAARLRPAERDSTAAPGHVAIRVAIMPGYFATVGTRLLRGRGFTDAELRPGAEPVVILSDAAARDLWPGEEALGQCVDVTREGWTTCARVVGIAENAHRGRVIEDEPAAIAYVPFGRPRIGPPGYSLIVRPVAGEPSALVAPVRQVMQTLRAGLPYADVRPMSTALDEELRSWRLGATMFGVFGGIAIVLSALGLYSVVAHLVAHRTREMGIRVALGARRADIAALVLTRAVRLAALGVLIGLVLALGAGRAVESLLYGVSPRDPVVFAIVSIVLLLVAVAASLLPVRRATRIDPIAALRVD